MIFLTYIYLLQDQHPRTAELCSAAFRDPPEKSGKAINQLQELEKAIPSHLEKTEAAEGVTKTVRSLPASPAEVTGVQAHLLQAHIWTAFVSFPALLPLMDRCPELAMELSAGTRAANSADCEKGARRLEKAHFALNSNSSIPEIIFDGRLKNPLTQSLRSR